MTVNLTCRDCDGRRLCETCRNAARTLQAAGFRVEHSTRYAALRAAAAGTYGFDACVVPVDADERAVIDAAVALLRGKRLALVMDGATGGSAAEGVTILDRARFAAGDFDVSWLTGSPLLQQTLPAPAMDESRSHPTGVDQTHATRRLKRLADDARAVVARAGLAAAPRLDLLAVLEDEVSWARASGRPFGAILVHLPGICAARAGEAPADVDKRLDQAALAIVRAVRSSDITSWRGDDFVIVLAEADEAGTALARARVAAAIDASGLRGPKSKRARGFAAWSIGSACYPADGTSRDALLARATASLQKL